MKSDLSLLQQKVENQSSEIVAIKKTVLSAEQAASACVEESRATRTMMTKLLDRFERVSSLECLTSQTTGVAPATPGQSKPLFPAMITREVHDTLCTTFGVGVRSDAKANTLRDKIEAEGMEFAEWWLEFYKNKTEEQWERKLRCLGAPSDLYTEASKEELGMLFFRFIDEDCTYSTQPLR